MAFDCFRLKKYKRESLRWKKETGQLLEFVVHLEKQNHDLESQLESLKMELKRNTEASRILAEQTLFDIKQSLKKMIDEKDKMKLALEITRREEAENELKIERNLIQRRTMYFVDQIKQRENEIQLLKSELEEKESELSFFSDEVRKLLKENDQLKLRQRDGTGLGGDQEG